MWCSPTCRKTRWRAASINGLMPGSGPSYDASKHAVVALTEDLFTLTGTYGIPVGVSVLCPAWVRTGIADAERKWPDRLGDSPPAIRGSEVVTPLVRHALDERMPPAEVANLVAEAITGSRFWVLPHPSSSSLPHAAGVASLTAKIQSSPSTSLACRRLPRSSARSARCWRCRRAKTADRPGRGTLGRPGGSRGRRPREPSSPRLV